MKLTRRDGLKLLGATALAASPLKAMAGSHGGMHEVQMLNKATDSNERQVFSPAVLQIAAGDTVKFVACSTGAVR